MTVDHLETWSAGVDADGQPVTTIRSSGVSGVLVAGLAGFGKTSLLYARFCQLTPSSAVQFVLIDGKGSPDYDGLFRWGNRIDFRVWPGCGPLDRT